MNKFLRLIRYDWPLHFVLLFTNWLPDNTPFLAFRGWLAHFFLGACGSNLRMGRNITLYNPSKVNFGKNIYVAFGCWFMAGDEINIDDEVLFGPYCVIVSSNHQSVNNSFRNSKPKHEPIHIGQGCWIGAHVTITAGAEIGAGSLVAAGAVVPGNIFPAQALIAGVPARFIKKLSDDVQS